MNIIIIEDERLTAEDLSEVIQQSDPQANVITMLGSVQESISYFKANEAPDLIFSDIQLGDGLCFEIFQAVAVKAPIVFCTAYDEYAIDAFRTNGIHYILKPYNEEEILTALNKYKILRTSFASDSNALVTVLQLLQQKEPAKISSILVHYKDRIIPVKMNEIAVFYIKNDVTHLHTFDQKIYTVGKTLDEVQQITGDVFYRANRQFIVNRQAVKDAAHYMARKVSITLNIPLEEKITISKEKVPHFLAWLAG